MPDQLSFKHTAVTLASSVAQTVVAQSASRSYLAVQNTGTGILTVGFSSAPTAIGLGLSLDPASAGGGQGGSWEWIEVVPQNAIVLYSAAGTTAVVVTA